MPNEETTPTVLDLERALAERLLRERDALREQVDRANLDFDTVNDHLADCQEALLKHGTPAGADGSVTVGITRLAEERDEARRQRDEALAALERVCRWARPRGSGDPLQPALDNGRAVLDCAALAKAGRHE